MNEQTIAEAAMGQHVIEYGITDAALAELKERYKEVDPTKDYDGAKAALKECTSLRTALENKRKELKKDALEYGRKVDSEAKRILGKILEVETPIKDAKQAIDDEAARIEAERVGRIQAMLKVLDVTPEFGATSSDLQETIDIVEAIVIDESYEEEIHRAKGLKADSLAKLRGAFAQAVQTEEAERELAAIKKKQKAEDERLAAERAEVKERERAAREEAARIEREREQLEADKRAEADRKQREADAAEAKRKKEEAEAEAKRQQEERDAAEAKAAAERAEALKPDRAKLIDMAVSLENYKMPKVKTPEADAILDVALADLCTVAANIRKHVGEMQ